MNKPLAIDLFCGLGGWTEGLQAAGFYVVGFDITKPMSYPGQLVLQDVTTIHGSQFKDARLIVASPPCQAYSYMAQPWSRAKAMAAAHWASPRKHKQLNKLFDACFRIQKQASRAARRRIPLVVENVKGAQPWVGKATFHYGSFYLWGDLPILMPQPGAKQGTNMSGQDWNRFKETGEISSHWTGQKVINQIKQRDGHKHTAHLTNQREHTGIKQGGDWFGKGENMSLARRHSSKSPGRKQASATIAKIPFELAYHIGSVYHPRNDPQ